jgi:hypothetical protein
LNISFEMLVGRVLECNIIDNGKGLNAHNLNFMFREVR